MAQSKTWFFAEMFFLSFSFLSAENSVRAVKLADSAATFLTRPVWRVEQTQPIPLGELYQLKETARVSEFSSIDSIESDVPPTIAEQLLADMDNRSDAGIVEGQDGDKLVEASFTDSAGRLRRFSYGAEQFSVRERDGIKTVVDSADGLVIRRSFDAEHHLIKQERFKIGSSSRDIDVLLTRDYIYRAGEKLPYQLIEERLSEHKRIVTDYDADGYAITRETAHYESPAAEDGAPADEMAEKAKLVLDKKSVWAYDDEKRLVAEETTTYSYTKTLAGREKVEQNRIKKLYEYDKAGGSHPDISYFENGILHIRTVYESENVYNETMYFDGGLTVQTRYEDGVKRAESILVNGNEMRRRSFE